MKRTLICFIVLELMMRARKVNLIQVQMMKILKLEVREASIQTWMTSWKILEVFQSMQETVTRE